MHIIEIDPMAHNHGPFPCNACALDALAELTPAERAVHDQLGRYGLDLDVDLQIAIASDLTAIALDAALPHRRFAKWVRAQIARLNSARGSH